MRHGSVLGKSIVIMNVHPSAAANPLGFTMREPFAPEALYHAKLRLLGTDSNQPLDLLVSRPIEQKRYRISI
jgi:hypothetical protein